MRRVGATAAALLAIITLGGCTTPLTGDDLLMCNAAQFLTTSLAITEETIRLDAPPEQAVERAVQARGLAEGAARTLHEVEPEAQAGATWQALIRAYTHAADSASALLPDFQELGTGGMSLQPARSALDEARLGLPPSCFDMVPG
jgi:hypothetical protein